VKSFIISGGEALALPGRRATFRERYRSRVKQEKFILGPAGIRTSRLTSDTAQQLASAFLRAA